MITGKKIKNEDENVRISIPTLSHLSREGHLQKDIM